MSSKGPTPFVLPQNVEPGPTEDGVCVSQRYFKKKIGCLGGGEFPDRGDVQEEVG